MLKFGIVLCFLFAFLQCYCELSQWETLSDAELANDLYSGYYHWRGPANGDEIVNTTLLMASFNAQSPCRALAIRDNCFSHNPQRADALLHRKFSQKSKIAPLNPKTILPLLKNNLILFVGDTTMSPVYASVVCHLSQFSEATYNLVWHYDYNNKVQVDEHQHECPNHPSCHLMGGDSYFAATNTTFRFMQLNAYYGRFKKQLQPIIHGKVAAPAAVVINFGVHYDEEERFRQDLTSFKEDLAKLQNRHHHTQTPIGPWFWLESMPQHFPGRGYYDVNATQLPLKAYRTAQAHFNLRCEAITDPVAYHKIDWRNRLVEQIMPDFMRNARLVQIAEALYDQWDAHVDNGDSFRSEAHTDCTHYCTASGVFRYVVQKVISSMLVCLRGNCPMGPAQGEAALPSAPPGLPSASTTKAKSIKRANPSGKLSSAACKRPTGGYKVGAIKGNLKDPNC